MPNNNLIDLTYFVGEERKFEAFDRKKSENDAISYKKNYSCSQPQKNLDLSVKSRNNNKASSNFESPSKNIEPVIFTTNNSQIEIIKYIEIIKKNNSNDTKSSTNNNTTNNNLLDVNNYETFCTGIFVSGIPKKITNDFLINITRDFEAPCRHSINSMIFIVPELLYKCANKDNSVNTEFNNLIASLCFPIGINICLECMYNDDEQNFEKNILNQKTFYNIIKNAKDENYYLTTLQYLNKIKVNDFMEKYSFNLIDYYKQKNPGIDTINNSNKNENNHFKKYMKILSHLMNNDFILIPEAISLLSKQPYYFPMNQCLNAILSINSEEKYNLINHILNEVPVPKKLKQIHFYVPSIDKPLILNNYFNIYKYITDKIINKNISDNEFSINQFDYKILFEKISLDNIIILFELILLEQQIVFIENDYQILSEIILILVDLIYPLTWTNPILPILSGKTVQFLQTPVPYIMGLDEYLLKFAYNNKNIYISKETILFNLITNNFQIGKTGKKIFRKDIIREYKIHLLPELIENFLVEELKIIKENREREENITKCYVEIEIKTIFLKLMAILFGDYNSYTFYTYDDNIPIFNEEAFIKSKKDKEIKLFMSQIMKTQNFNQFLFNERELYFCNYYKTKNEIANDDSNRDNNSYKNEFIDTSYFKKLTADLSSLNNFQLGKFSLNKKNLLYAKKNLSKSMINIFKDNINCKNSNNEELIKDTNIKEEHDGQEILTTNKEKYFNNLLIKNKIEIKKYLLYPYFLPIIKNEDFIKLNQETLSNNIISFNNNNKYNIPNENNIYIIDNNFTYNFEKIIPKNIYIFPNKKIVTNIDPKSNNEQYNNRRNTANLLNNIINDNNIEIAEKNINFTPKLELKSEFYKRNFAKINLLNPKIIVPNNTEDTELITLCFTLCCTNKRRISSFQFSQLEFIFKEHINKLFFANLLTPDMRIVNKSQHKQLAPKAFDDLQKMIVICLEQVTIKETKICRLLTIACFSYYKIEKDKNLVYLYEYFRTKILYPCPMWLLDKFWIEFFLVGIEETKNKQEDLKRIYEKNNSNNNNNVFNISSSFDFDKSVIEIKSKENILMDNALYIADIMHKLNINPIFIKNVFEKNILPIFEWENGFDKIILGKINEKL